MTPLNTKAAEIRAGLVERARAYRPYNALNDGALVASLLALIEQQAAELAEARASEASLTKRRDYYRERMAAAGGELNRVSAAIGSVRFMDTPDGGDVSLAEQVKRMRETLTTAKAERDKLLREKERMGEALRKLHDAASVFHNAALVHLSDTTFDSDGGLSEADAELSVNALPGARSALGCQPAVPYRPRNFAEADKGLLHDRENRLPPDDHRVPDAAHAALSSAPLGEAGDLLTTISNLPADFIDDGNCCAGKLKEHRP